MAEKILTGLEEVFATSNPSDGDLITWSSVANGNSGAWVARTSLASSSPVKVSPTGLATPGVNLPNNGAPFGPDTLGTTTGGIQEAINSLPTAPGKNSVGNAITVTSGKILILPGLIQKTGTIVIPPGSITIEGSGKSIWSGAAGTFLPTDYFGGTTIVHTNPAVSAMTVPLDSHGFPSTHLVLSNFDLRTVSPATYQGGAPDVLNLFGFETGSVSEITVVEVSPSGGVGTNLNNICQAYIGAATDDGVIENCEFFGGTTCFIINRAHTRLSNIIAGGSRFLAFQLNQNLDNRFANLHAYNVPYGMTWAPYSASPTTPAPFVIQGFMFEAITSHYIAPQVGGVSCCLIIDGAIWNTGGINPLTDVNGLLAADSLSYSLSNPAAPGYAFITRNEIDTVGYGTNRHVTVPKAALTAGASPYTFPAYPFDCVFILTTAAGLSALTLDGTPVSTSIGVPIWVGSGHSLVANWATTAPTFTVIPQ